MLYVGYVLAALVHSQAVAHKDGTARCITVPALCLTSAGNLKLAGVSCSHVLESCEAVKHFHTAHRFNL